MSLKLPDSNLIFQSKDPNDPRIGKFIHFKNISELQKDCICILGYPDDTGIKMNGGRIGASEGPQTVRQVLYKMTPHVFQKDTPAIDDIGDLVPQLDLTQTHQQAQTYAEAVLRKGTLISLGGGHDFGYPDAAAFLEASSIQNLRPLVINFDAHLDVRPTDRGHHSGTPFRRLLNKYPQKFDFIEIGIQPQCNSREHYEWVISQGATVISNELIHKKGLQELLSEMLEPDLKRPLWISLDIDVFSSNEAPGASQSWPVGLRTQQFLPALQWLTENFNSKGIGIYEVSPPLDHDHRTSKLAALVIHHYISTHRKSSI